MVAVADRVRVAEADHRDRRQQGAAVLGEPDAQPALARRRPGPDLAVELRGAVRLYGGRDGGERDRAHAGRAAAPGPSRPRVVDSEADAAAPAGEHAAPERRGGARARRCRTLVARRL